MTPSHQETCRVRRWWRFSPRLGLTILLLVGLSAVGVLPGVETPPKQPPGAAALDDQPEVLAAKSKRSEAEQDRLDALALFSTARVAEDRGDLPRALRLYERAFGSDPRSGSIAWAVVTAAIQLDSRYDEAARYASLEDIEFRDANVLLLTRLGVYLADNEDPAAALRSP